ncbi:MAG: RIP metalloprotease RseP [Anaerolineae bacterium]|nr:RIP metalloprotease RseP [Anaerolineae bacterium]
MDSFFLGLASFVIVLVPLVIIHEFGHFIAAKLVGITVLEFGIGFPPRALKLFERGDTIYTINWLPIGGFVRPYGEDFVRQKTEDELSLDRQEIEERGIKNPKSVFQAGPWERMFFMAAGPGINFLAALVLFIVVALIGWPYERWHVTVYDIQERSVAADIGLEQGDVIVSANGEKMESADQFNDWLADHANESVTLLMERDGEQFEKSFVAPPSTDTDVQRVYINSVEADMPASDAGFEPEDLIVAVDDVEITSLDQLVEITGQHEDEEMVVTVLRGTERYDLPVTPRDDGSGKVRIGIGISEAEPASVGLVAVNRDRDVYTVAQPLGKAISLGVDEFVFLHEVMYDFVKDIFAGNVSASEARPVSPVGIGQMSVPVFEQSIDEGEVYPIIRLAALISVALAITNLLPIPGLDGGRILFVVIELIRGKPMEPEREGMIHLIGVLLLLGIVFFTVINDIFNPIDVSGLR